MCAAQYNQESQFEHVFASGHPELAASYWGSILEYSNYTAGTTNGVGAHLAETMASAAKLNGSCPDGYGILFPCHIAPWGYQSADQSRYNLFNGMYAATIFLNDYEYTLNKTFATSATYPLIDGFTRFWHCKLQLGADGYLHDTASAAQSGEDSPFEGGNTNDPVTSLALIKRLATFQIRLAEELGLTAPVYVSEMVAKLAPFATARNQDGQLVQVNSPTLNISKSGCSGSGSCDPFFPVFPSELVDPLNASAATKALENATAFEYTSNMHNLGLAVFWPFVIRSTPRSMAVQVVDAFISNAAGRIGNNLIKYATGGGTENAGLALAVTDMLVHAPGGKFIVLFPAWPVAEPASFVNLLAKGGWRVSAGWDASARAAIDVTITNAVQGSGVRTCWLQNPWGSTSGVVTCGGKAVAVAREGELLSWPAPEGAACSVGKHQQERAL